MPDIRRLTAPLRGFTLIELMIAVALIGLLAVVAAPFGGGWMNDADVQSTSSSLRLAYGKAKSMALRNPVNAYETSTGVREIAAGIKNDNGTLLVCEGDPSSGNCVSGGGAVVWSQSLPDGVSVTINDVQMTAHGLDNTGQSFNLGEPIVLAYRVSKGTKSYESEFR